MGAGEDVGGYGVGFGLEVENGYLFGNREKNMCIYSSLSIHSMRNMSALIG